MSCSRTQHSASGESQICNNLIQLSQCPSHILRKYCTFLFFQFGMNKVFKDHDTVIEEIQARVEECRLELAELEVEAGIESARQYFRKRSNSTL